MDACVEMGPIAGAVRWWSLCTRVVVYKFTVAESRAYSDQISDHHLRSACAMRPDRDG